MQGTPYFDCVILASEESGREEPDAWLEAAAGAGLLAEVRSLSELDTASLEDGLIAFGDTSAESLILSGMTEVRAGALDTLLNFILLGGRILASGVAFDQMPVADAEGRSAGSLVRELETVERHVSRMEDGDRISEEIVAAGLPGVGRSRPVFDSGTERSMERERVSGFTCWRSVLETRTDIQVSLYLPKPVKSISVVTASGVREIGSAAGPDLSVCLPAGKTEIVFEEAQDPLEILIVSEDGWFSEDAEGKARAVSGEDWACSGSEAAHTYGISFLREDVPDAPGSLRVDAGVCSGCLRVTLNGTLLSEVSETEPVYAVPPELIQEQNTLLLRVTPDEESRESDDGLCGIFTEPRWVAVDADENWGFSAV